MKLNLYSLKNRLSGFFERPVAEMSEPNDYLEGLAQSLALAPITELERYKEYDVYYFGKFDNKSGDIFPSNEFVGSLEAICIGYLDHKKEAANGKEERAA